MSDTLIGRTLGHFKIESKLGQGGMALVYKAMQTNLHRTVALKILPPEMTFDQSYIARFQQEARAAAGLEHSHIVPIYEIGEAEGFYYIAMKYIEGGTLKELIDRDAPLPLPRVLELLEPVGKALDYAHKRGVVHRDIKPSNVMITPEGWVYLTDFGLARGNNEGTAGLTQAGTIMGTPEYMSPEQAQGLVVGPPSDLYALAIMVYEMLSHGMPFTGDNPQSVLFARVMRAPKPPSEYLKTIPSRIEDVLMKALARSPEARFESAAALFAALRTAGGLGAERKESPSKPTIDDEATIITARPPSYPPQQPSYPPQGQQPGYGRPASQPSYPPQGQQPSYPPQGQQPSYPPQGQQPGYGRPASQPSYPPQGQQPSYPPPGGYVAGPNAPQMAQNYAGPAGPANAQQPSYPPAAPSYPPAPAAYAPKAKSGKGLWIALIALVLVGGGLGGYFLFGRPNAGPDIARGASAFDRKGGLAEAEAAFQAAVAKDGASFEAHERLALTHLMRGKAEDSERVALQAINLQPNDVAPHVWLSQAYSEQRQYNEALAQAEESVRLGPNNTLAYLARATSRADLALVHNDEDLLAQAAEDADRAIELAQSDPSRFNQAMAYNAKGYVQWQTYQYQTARDSTAGAELVDDGIDQFNRAIGLQDQLPMLHSNLGYFYAQQGYVADFKGDSAAAERFGKAMASFDAAIGLDADYGPAYAGKGWTVIDQRSYEEAIKFFDEALARNSRDANALAGRGLAHWWLGVLGGGDSAQDFKTAAADYEAAIQAAPAYLSAYVDLGSIYLYSLDDQARAEDTYNRALEQDPRFAPAIAGVGDVLYAQNYYPEAIEKYDQALAINPEIATAHLGKANSQAALGQYEESLGSYDLALSHNSTLANAYLGKAIAEEQLGDIDGARATLEEGLLKVRESDQPSLQEKLDGLQ